MKIWLLIFIALPIWAANLLTHNIYERDERIDIMLSFDAPYDGTIKQQNNADLTYIILSDLSLKGQVSKQIKSNIIQNILITSANNSATLQLKSSKPISIVASKTSDKFGLRIRVTPQIPIKSTNQSAIEKTAQSAQNIKPTQVANTQPKEQNPLANIPTKKDSGDDMYTNYIIVILVLFTLFVFLMFIKAKYTKKNQQAKSIQTTKTTINTPKVTPNPKPFDIATPNPQVSQNYQTADFQIEQNHQSTTNSQSAQSYQTAQDFQSSPNLQANSNYQTASNFQATTASISNFNWSDESVDVLYEKSLDAQNKVVLLNYENQKYLALVGNSNVLLDKFGEDGIKSQDDFELIIQQSKPKLNSYLQERKNALSSYKDMMDKESI